VLAARAERSPIFEQQAKANPSAFLALLGKVLPTQHCGEDGGPIAHYVMSDRLDLPLGEIFPTASVNCYIY
jgi:hypothetical protein